MQKSLIIGLLSSLLLVVFALKNNANVELDFIIGKPINGSLSLILLITIIIGIFFGLLLSYPTFKKYKKKIADNSSEITKLTNILDEYKNRASGSKTEEKIESKEEKTEE
ncbi:MAG: DUF1049 domain-containing protein [Bacteroidales bacterium]|nr:DUF1049 domain-containing protein [Bacteroidales bacterium]